MEQASSTLLSRQSDQQAAGLEKDARQQYRIFLGPQALSLGRPRPPGVQKHPTELLRAFASS